MFVIGLTLLGFATLILSARLIASAVIAGAAMRADAVSWKEVFPCAWYEVGRMVQVSFYATLIAGLVCMALGPYFTVRL